MIILQVMRQNTEGEYAMLEHESVDGVVESLKIITEASTERLCRQGRIQERDLSLWVGRG